MFVRQTDAKCSVNELIVPTLSLEHLLSRYIAKGKWWFFQKNFSTNCQNDYGLVDK